MLTWPSGELAEHAAKTHSRSVKILQATAPTTAQVQGGGTRPRNYLLSLDFPAWPPPEVGTWW